MSTRCPRRTSATVTSSLVRELKERRASARAEEREAIGADFAARRCGGWAAVRGGGAFSVCAASERGSAATLSSPPATRAPRPAAAKCTRRTCGGPRCSAPSRTRGWGQPTWLGWRDDPCPMRGAARSRRADTTTSRRARRSRAPSARQNSQLRQYLASKTARYAAAPSARAARWHPLRRLPPRAARDDGEIGSPRASMSTRHARRDARLQARRRPRRAAPATSGLRRTRTHRRLRQQIRRRQHKYDVTLTGGDARAAPTCDYVKVTSPRDGAAQRAPRIATAKSCNVLPFGIAGTPDGAAGSCRSSSGATAGRRVAGRGSGATSRSAPPPRSRRTPSLASRARARPPAVLVGDGQQRCDDDAAARRRARRGARRRGRRRGPGSRRRRRRDPAPPAEAPR